MDGLTMKEVVSECLWCLACMSLAVVLTMLVLSL